MIFIARYDPQWPVMFAAEAARIHDAFGAEADRIDHVGSTSVSGLDAKPVIDIQVSVSSFQRRDWQYQRLTELGYTHFPLGEFDQVYPFFKLPKSWPSTHHVHLCVSGSVEERDHLAFRDYLRAHPSTAAEYLELKRTLAAAHDGLSMQSQENYSLSKSGFVRRVLQAAAGFSLPD